MITSIAFAGKLESRNERKTIRLVAFLVALLVPATLGSGAGLQSASVADLLQSPSDSAGGDSWSPVASSNGRFVLFASSANNLVAINSTNLLPLQPAPCFNVFLRDRTNATTTLVSASLAGNQGGNADSWPLAVSDDGSHALFESNASNLVPGDTNNTADVFVRDLVNDLTELISVSAYGGIANGVSRDSVMTPDGRYVAFASLATNLVAGDDNGIQDVCVRDRQNQTTTLVTVNASRGQSNAPEITPDGRYVAFYSTSSNLVAGYQASGDIFVRDLTAGTTTWVSADARALLDSSLNTTNGVCYSHALSANGDFVVYQASPIWGSTEATIGLILRHHLPSGNTVIIHTNAAVLTGYYEEAHHLELTPDGRFVAFVANANDTKGTNTCILRWDAESTTNELISGDLSNAVPANTFCKWPAIDASGRFIAFICNATNLSTNALSGEYHLFVRDVLTGGTRLVAVNTNGLGLPVSLACVPRMTADGGFVAFESSSETLTPGDRNHRFDVFTHNLMSKATELVSVRHAALPSSSPNDPSIPSRFSISDDGRFIPFSSTADNLTANDTNDCADVFIRDVLAGTNLLVSVNTNNISSGNGASTGCAVSEDGRFVVFESLASDLVPGDTNNAQDVFVRDLQTRTTTLVSTSVNGSGPGNKNSYAPTISSDGRYVLFRGQATNLVDPLVTGTENLFRRDLQSGTNQALTTAGVSFASMTRDGKYVLAGNAPILGGTASSLSVWTLTNAAPAYTLTQSGMSRANISPDGKWIVFVTSGSLRLRDRFGNTDRTLGNVFFSPTVGARFSDDSRFLVYATTTKVTSNDSNSLNDVYLYDTLGATNFLISRAFATAGAGNGESDSPAINPDGRFVAFRSFASNLVPGDTNSSSDIFLHDRMSGATLLVSANSLGSSSGNSRSFDPLFSGDSQSLLFQSSASDLAAGDSNDSSDIFLVSLGSAGAIPAFQVEIIPAGTLGSAPWLTWLVQPGKSYYAQYKHDLNEPNWQDLNVGVTIIGSQGYLTDSTAQAGRRFYRIVGF